MARYPQKRLPLQISNFERLRTLNRIYVDKTALINDLCEVEGTLCFLSRPRRFGKSLLLSTMECLFTKGVEAFQGLAIADLWQDGRYNVLRLDFSQIGVFQTQEGFAQKFGNLLERQIRPIDLSYQTQSDDVANGFAQWLEKQPQGSLVLLIDEYDEPLVRVIGNKDLFAAVRDTMRDFFAVVKGVSESLRFFFMTGITRYNHTNIFSAFNNLKDITFHPKYGAILGYTEDEIKVYFSEYIKQSAEALGQGEAWVMENLRRHYDGYSFDKEVSTHVYSPWSVLNFFSDPRLGFDDYWFNSGAFPKVLDKYLGTHDELNPHDYRRPQFIDISEISIPYDYDVGTSVNSLKPQSIRK